MPTGGVNEKNLLDYLAFDKIIACGGSWMVDKEAVATKNFAKITELTRSAVKTMLGFELKQHRRQLRRSRGSAQGRQEVLRAVRLGGQGRQLFHFRRHRCGVHEGSLPGQERPHRRGYPTSVVRAKAYLESQGFEFDESTAKYKGEKPQRHLPKDEIGGFAIHLVNK